MSSDTSFLERNFYRILYTVSALFPCAGLAFYFVNQVNDNMYGRNGLVTYQKVLVMIVGGVAGIIHLSIGNSLGSEHFLAPVFMLLVYGNFGLAIFIPAAYGKGD